MASSWQTFTGFTAQVNSFLPASLAPSLAVGATVAEIIIALLLIAGYKTRGAALAGALLTLCFFICMSISFGMQKPMNYSVLVDAASALLLATMPAYRWSVDAWLDHQKMLSGMQVYPH